MGWRTRKDGKHYNTDKKVRDISNDGDDVEVNVNVDVDDDELEEFARDKVMESELVNEMTTEEADAMAHFGIDPVMYDNYPKSYIKKLVKRWHEEEGQE